MMKTLLAFVVGFVLASGFVYAQTTTANQGAPGNQGAWYVRNAVPTFPADGGVGGGAAGVFPYACSTSSPNKTTTVSTAASVPTSAASNRLYVVLCNTRENSSGTVKCRADGTTPIVDAGAPGDVLGVGDCIAYTNPSGFPVKCVAASSEYVSSYECVK
jgi:hypothetical protein